MWCTACYQFIDFVIHCLQYQNETDYVIVWFHFGPESALWPCYEFLDLYTRVWKRMIWVNLLATQWIPGRSMLSPSSQTTPSMYWCSSFYFLTGGNIMHTQEMPCQWKHGNLEKLTWHHISEVFGNLGNGHGHGMVCFKVRVGVKRFLEVFFVTKFLSGSE